MIRFVFAATILTAIAPAATCGAEPDSVVPPGPNRPDEPLREEFSVEAAVRFLDSA